MKNKAYTERAGITLISLVITIVVLIILAGITVVMLSGENGIIKKAGEAKKQNQKMSTIENIELAVLHTMNNNDQINKEDLEISLNEYFSSFNLRDIDNQIFSLEINEDTYKIDMEGKVKEDLIPDEYQRVEYIKKNGIVKDEHIDTGVEGTTETRIVMNYMKTR